MPDEIEDLLKSVFNAIKKTDPIDPSELAVSFGADFPQGAVKENSEVKSMPVTPEQIASAAKRDDIFPPNVPQEFREEHMRLAHGASLLLAGFVALNEGMRDDITDEQTKKLFLSAQNLCNKGQTVLKGLKNLQIVVSKPDAKGSLTLQLINRKNRKKED